MTPIVYRGWVYGIQSGQFIKVGIASNIPRRMHAMRLHNPHQLHVVLRRRCESPLFVERRMHEILKPHALGREWFDVTPAQVRAAADIALQDEAARRVTQLMWESESAEKADRRLARSTEKRLANEARTVKKRVAKIKLRPGYETGAEA